MRLLVLSIILIASALTSAKAGIEVNNFDGFQFSSGDKRQRLTLSPGVQCESPEIVIFTPHRSTDSRTITLGPRVGKNSNFLIEEADGSIIMEARFRGPGTYSFCNGQFVFSVGASENLIEADVPPTPPDFFGWESLLFAPVLDIPETPGRAVRVPGSTDSLSLRARVTYGTPTMQINGEATPTRNYAKLSEVFQSAGLINDVWEFPNGGALDSSEPSPLTGQLYFISGFEYRAAAQKVLLGDFTNLITSETISRPVGQPTSIERSPESPPGVVCPLYNFTWDIDVSFAADPSLEGGAGREIRPNHFYIVVFVVDAPQYRDEMEGSVEALAGGVVENALLFDYPSGSSPLIEVPALRSAGGMRLFTSAPQGRSVVVSATTGNLSVANDSDDGDLLPDLWESAILGSVDYSDGTFDEDGDASHDLVDFIYGQDSSTHPLIRILVDDEFGEEILFNRRWITGSWFVRAIEGLEVTFSQRSLLTTDDRIDRRRDSIQLYIESVSSSVNGLIHTATADDYISEAGNTSIHPWRSESLSLPLDAIFPERLTVSWALVGGDNDGINWLEELSLGTDPFISNREYFDTDFDGVSNSRESELGSDPGHFDTNGDGISDRVALEWNLSATSTDTDGDGITNAEEARRGLNYLSPDSDGDGVDDGRDLYPLDPELSVQPASAGEITITLISPEATLVQ